jgi:hypothetical protein
LIVVDATVVPQLQWWSSAFNRSGEIPWLKCCVLLSLPNFPSSTPFCSHQLAKFWIAPIDPFEVAAIGDVAKGLPEPGMPKSPGVMET